MEAQLVESVPSGDGWLYEPKWDGFRCLVFRDGDNVAMRSKSGQPLERYFPEVKEAVLALSANTFVLDGEIVVTVGDEFSFDDLLERIHPAESRIKKLAATNPATLILFDILADDRGSSLVSLPIEERRKSLEKFAGKYIQENERIKLSPSTTDYEVAKEWWELVGKGLDGLIAKKLGVAYQSGNRKGMLKIKKMRTADCVVGGFRYGTNSKLVGSLLLGLYDPDGLLHHVGFSSSIRAADKKALTEKLEAIEGGEGFSGNRPGGPSRWSTERSADWHPLKTELVCEVQYDHFTGNRFRHGTKFLRWRPDKKPQQCTLAQVLAGPVSSAFLLRA